MVTVVYKTSVVVDPTAQLLWCGGFSLAALKGLEASFSP